MWKRVMGWSGFALTPLLRGRHHPMTVRYRELAMRLTYLVRLYTLCVRFEVVSLGALLVLVVQFPYFVHRRLQTSNGVSSRADCSTEYE